MIKFTVNKPEENITYSPRPGAYAVIIKNNKLLTVKTSTGYFLPGGGIKKSEHKEVCLKRECIEEIGYNIKINKLYCQGRYFFYSTTLNYYMESIGYFYNCELLEKVETKTEDDHKLIWIDMKDTEKLLYVKNQKEAINIWRKQNKNTSSN